MFIWLMYPESQSIAGGQGRNLEAEADAEGMEGAVHWRVPLGLPGLLSYRTQDHQPRNGTTHSGLGRFPSITN